MDKNRRVQAIIFAYICIGVCLAAVTLYFFEPGKSGLFPSCLLYEYSGFYCPGCGSTRAMSKIVHGDVVAALRMNILTVFFTPFIIYSFLLFGSRIFLKKPLPSYRIPAIVIWGLVVVIILFGILRNLPYYPFYFLAPH